MESITIKLTRGQLEKLELLKKVIIKAADESKKTGINKRCDILADIQISDGELKCYIVDNIAMKLIKAVYHTYEESRLRNEA